MKLSPAGYVHATAVMIDGKGVLIRGQSRAGKSTLAEALMAEARRAGLAAVLVGDDRVRIFDKGGTLMLSPHPVIAGLIERRGEGIIPMAHVAEAPLALVIQLGPRAGAVIADMHGEGLDVILDRGITRLDFSVRQPAAAILPLVLAALAK